MLRVYVKISEGGATNGVLPARTPVYSQQIHKGLPLASLALLGTKADFWILMCIRICRTPVAEPPPYGYVN